MLLFIHSSKKVNLAMLLYISIVRNISSKKVNLAMLLYISIFVRVTFIAAPPSLCHKSAMFRGCHIRITFSELDFLTPLNSTVFKK